MFLAFFQFILKTVIGPIDMAAHILVTSKLSIHYYRTQVDLFYLSFQIVITDAYRPASLSMMKNSADEDSKEKLI